VDLSIRLEKAGFKICFIERAYVYHKRRTTWRSFFRQVFRFGAARVLLARRHPGELRLTHLFPAFFVVGFVFMFFFALFRPAMALSLGGILAIYFLAIGFEAAVKNHNVALFFPAMGAAFIQLSGYGLGFLRNVWEVYIRRRPEGIPL
jgi:GT2 family glycosyltransferase